MASRRLATSCPASTHTSEDGLGTVGKPSPSDVTDRSPRNTSRRSARISAKDLPSDRSQTCSTECELDSLRISACSRWTSRSCKTWIAAEPSSARLGSAASAFLSSCWTCFICLACESFIAASSCASSRATSDISSASSRFNEWSSDQPASCPVSVSSRKRFILAARASHAMQRLVGSLATAPKDLFARQGCCGSDAGSSLSELGAASARRESSSRVRASSLDSNSTHLASALRATAVDVSCPYSARSGSSRSVQGGDAIPIPTEPRNASSSLRRASNSALPRGLRGGSISRRSAFNCASASAQYGHGPLVGSAMEGSPHCSSPLPCSA
eukprot:scaffold80206_cov27-Tisochrysis_lutea.AAC.2